ncbi:MAG: PAS domain S-box protein [Myxococcales bacterium]|nr:PAS domain S-box protein [Myxococcales bacterium]
MGLPAENEKWMELARCRQRVRVLETELGLDSTTHSVSSTAADAAWYALVAEHATDAITVNAPNTSIEYASPSCERLFGWTPDELVGVNAYELVHPDDLAIVAAAHARGHEGVPQRLEYRLRCADGQHRWVETTARPLMADGALARMVCITRDIHEKQLAQKALERSNADLRQFALVAAHDLHEPLRTVASFADLLARRYRDRLDTRGEGYLDFIVANVDRMRRLIDDLLSYTRIEVDEHERTLVDLSEVLSTVLVDLNGALTAAGAEVEASALPSVPGERTHLVLLFRHLIDNAVKFRRGDTPPRIRIHAERAGPDWHLSFADNGRGFDEDDAERIFEMFERLVGPSDVPGSGIGLAAARRIIERHAGRIYAESELGGGATFHIELPAGVRD